MITLKLWTGTESIRELGCETSVTSRAIQQRKMEAPHKYLGQDRLSSMKVPKSIMANVKLRRVNMSSGIAPICPFFVLFHMPFWMRESVKLRDSGRFSPYGESHHLKKRCSAQFGFHSLIFLLTGSSFRSRCVSFSYS